MENKNFDLLAHFVRLGITPESILAEAKSKFTNTFYLENRDSILRDILHDKIAWVLLIADKLTGKKTDPNPSWVKKTCDEAIEQIVRFND